MNCYRFCCTILTHNAALIVTVFAAHLIAENAALLFTDYRIGFSKSLFHTNDLISENIDLLFRHKELFVAEHKTSAPLNLAFSGLCDLDSQRAEKRFYEMYKFEYNPRGNSIVGSPAYFSDRLGAFQEETGIEEFIFKDLDKDNCHRLKTLSALSNLISDHYSKAENATIK